MKINLYHLAKISVASVCALLWIWVLPNTIALRHLLLGIGFIAGAFIIKSNWTLLSSFSPSKIPLILVSSLFIWVGIHYFFFSLNPELELSEIGGLWIRTFAGFVMAIGFGISLCRHENLRKYFYFSIFAVPIINVSAFLYSSYLQGSFISALNSFIFFIFAKIETAYFGGIAIAIAVANLIYILYRKRGKTSILQITLYFLGITVALLSAFLSNTKNGIAIGLGMCGILMLTISFQVLLNFKCLKKSSLLVGMLSIVLVTLVWQAHKSHASDGWSTIFEDVKVSIDIDKNTQWQHREGTVPAPMNSLGVPAAMNTYSRFSYIAVGTRLIGQYPLGYGSVNRSFNGMQDHAKIYHEHTGQVHSGWVDFGLAFGLPGLCLIFFALIFIIYFGATDNSELSLNALMICLMIIPFGFIAEISYKQYFEATIFFIVLASTLVAFSSAESRMKAI